MQPTTTTVVIRSATSNDHQKIADLYIASRSDALPSVKKIWSDDDIRGWIRRMFDEQEREGLRSVAEMGDQIVGFLRVVGEEVDQLYIRPGFYRQGIGSLLLAKAREVSPERLRLYTFQVNTRAKAFYEHHGFRVVDFNDGSRNEENEPDILYEWRCKNA